MPDIINMTITTPPAVNMTIATQVGASQSITGFGIKGDKGDAGDPATNLVTSVAGKTGAVTLDKTDVGLSNVDNTSDANKPISIATQAALDTKASTTALTAHTSSTANPHNVTKEQVGLGATDNVQFKQITSGTTTDVLGTAISVLRNNVAVGRIDNNASGLRVQAQSGTLQLRGTGNTGLAIDASGNTVGAGTITATNLSGTNTGDQPLGSRTITGTANQITVTNGDGVSGNPTLSLPNAITLPGTLTITGHTSPQADSTYTLGTSSLYWKETYTDKLFLNSTATLDGSTAGEIKGTGIFTADNIKRGTGSPEGVVTAPVGTYYTDTAITNGAMRWAKKAGTGNTGWQVVDGDTGRRDVASLLNPTHWTATPNILCVRRVGNLVTCEASPSSPGAVVVSGSTTSLFDMPLGFRPKTTSMAAARNASSGFVGTFEATNYGTYETRIRVGTAVPGQGWQFTLVYFTNDPWPTTLPGTAA